MRAIHWKILRFLFSGGTGAAINLALLYLLAEWVGWHYLPAAILAFLVAMVASFLLQKFWTFTDQRPEVWHKQLLFFAAVAIINTGINTGIVYVLVEMWGVHYLLSQIIASALIALESFVVYQFLVFGLHVEKTELPL